MTLMDPRWTPDSHGFPVLGSLTPAEKDRRDRAVPDRASKIQTWTRSGAQSGMGAIRLLWGAVYEHPDGECGRQETAGRRDG